MARAPCPGTNSSSRCSTTWRGRPRRSTSAEREAELADRSRAEYRQVTLGQPADGPRGDRSRSTVPASAASRASSHRVGDGWCLVSGQARTGSCRSRRIAVVHGASDRSVPEVAWSPLHRLGLALGAAPAGRVRVRCVVHLADGRQHEASCAASAPTSSRSARRATSALLVAYDALGAVQSRDDCDR